MQHCSVKMALCGRGAVLARGCGCVAVRPVASWPFCRPLPCLVLFVVSEEPRSAQGFYSWLSTAFCPSPCHLCTCHKKSSSTSCSLGARHNPLALFCPYMSSWGPCAPLLPWVWHLALFLRRLLGEAAVRCRLRRSYEVQQAVSHEAGRAWQLRASTKLA